MDRFRVYALEKLLCDERLTGENRQFVLQMLSEKCGILCKGFSKRKKIKEAEYYLHLKEKYESGFDSTLSVDALSNLFKKDDFNFMDDGRSW